MAVSRSDAAREYDAIVVGSGISGGWAAKELCEHGLRTLVLEAGPPIVPERDYVEHVRPWELHFRGRGDRHALDRDQWIQTAGLRRVERQVLRQRPRESLCQRPRQALHLDPRPPRGRALPDVGPAGLPLERPRLRGQRPGGDRGGLAHPLRRHRALVRSRRAVHRRERPGRRAGAPARRAVPPAHGAELRRAGDAGGGVGAMEGRAAPDDRALRHPHPAPQRPHGVPLLRSLLAGLHHPFLLQQHRLHPAGRRAHRPPHPPAGQRGGERAVRRAARPRHRRPRHRWEHPPGARVPRPGRLPLCLGPGERPDPAQQQEPALSHGARQLQRRAGPQPDGPRLRRRGQRARSRDARR